MAVWDLRKKNGAMLSLKAHEEDVNVISWNRNVTYLMASGSDDGSFKIWDLRAFGSGEPVAQFRWHQVRAYPCRHNFRTKYTPSLLMSYWATLCALPVHLQVVTSMLGKKSLIRKWGDNLTGDLEPLLPL